MIYSDPELRPCCECYLLVKRRSSHFLIPAHKAAADKNGVAVPVGNSDPLLCPGSYCIPADAKDIAMWALPTNDPKQNTARAKLRADMD